MSYLLDTNVLSEPRKATPNPNVILWMESVPQEQFFLSTLTLGEIRKGVELHAEGARKLLLTSWLEYDVPNWFDGRIIPIDRKVAERWGLVSARTPRTLPAIDGLIAASCLAYGLILVTRNIKDFADIEGLRIFNPWEGTT